MKPFTEDTDPLRGGMNEIISAMSSLNMPAEQIKEPTKEEFYLSQTDRWANHAVEHLKQALVYLRKVPRT